MMSTEDEAEAALICLRSWHYWSCFKQEELNGRLCELVAVSLPAADGRSVSDRSQFRIHPDCEGVPCGDSATLCVWPYAS
jgi:hypothetical protein